MDSRCELLARGTGFGEGPVWREDTQDLVFCSMSTGRILRWSDRDGLSTAATFSAGGPNGLARGADGTLYVAQCGGTFPAPHDVRAPGGVQRVGDDGAPSWVSLHPVSPNDICMGPDGWLYTTDPTRPAEKDDGRLWRVDPRTGESELLFSVPYFINGIGFDANDDLHVSSTNDRRIIRFPNEGDGRFGRPEVVLTLEHNHPDGFAFDLDGNLTIAAVSRDERPGDVQLWSRQGRLIESIEVSAALKVTNVALTPDADLYVTVGDGQELVRVSGRPAPALALHPFRAK